MISSALMERCLRRVALSIGIEGDLRVHYFQEKLSLALGEQCELRLAWHLNEEMIALT